MRSRVVTALAAAGLVALLAAASTNNILQVLPVSADGGTAQISTTGVVVVTSRDGSLPGVIEMGGYAKTAGCVEVACNTTGDGGLLNLTVETDYELGVTTNSPVRLANGVSCVAFTSGTGVGKVINEGSVRYWRAPAGTGPDGGVAKYECCALTAHSASAPVIVQACPR